ncbi:hypothetical protein PG913_02295 [Tenacibaculum pacificus]|nr:hypothetical protein [Tenacibaculum pacificus]WBX74092.1 hypothetical protein PG913_02295 [Tenacibaculum pacificus]
MKKIIQFLELLWLLIVLPLEVSNGSKKGAYQKIKRQMILVNLL